MNWLVYELTGLWNGWFTNWRHIYWVYELTVYEMTVNEMTWCLSDYLSFSLRQLLPSVGRLQSAIKMQTTTHLIQVGKCKTIRSDVIQILPRLNKRAGSEISATAELYPSVLPICYRALWQQSV